MKVKNKGFWEFFLQNIWWFQKLSLTLHREIKSDTSLLVGQHDDKHIISDDYLASTMLIATHLKHSRGIEC